MKKGSDAARTKKKKAAMAFYRLQTSSREHLAVFGSYPNGTSLDRAISIRFAGLADHDLILWVPDHCATREHIAGVLAMPGVVSFERIEPQPAISPHDRRFVFDDAWLEQLFGAGR